GNGRACQGDRPPLHLLRGLWTLAGRPRPRRGRRAGARVPAPHGKRGEPRGQVETQAADDRRRRHGWHRCTHGGPRRDPQRQGHHPARGGVVPRPRAQRTPRPAGSERPVTASEGAAVTHRRYVPHGHAHYGGALVDGAYVLGLFGDAATELCIRTDGDEGLFAAYDSVEFLAPVQAGDVVEVSAEIDRVGQRSRGVTFVARLVCRADPARGPSAAPVVGAPAVVVRAHGPV